MSPELAERLAADASHIPGIASVVVANRNGVVRGSSGHFDPERGAALGRFLAARADAASSQDDQRGLGRMLAGSHVEEIRFSGSTGEGVVLVTADDLLLALLDRGVAGDTVQPALRTAIRRYEGTTR